MACVNIRNDETQLRSWALQKKFLQKKGMQPHYILQKMRGTRIRHYYLKSNNSGSEFDAKIKCTNSDDVEKYVRLHQGLFVFILKE